MKIKYIYTIVREYETSSLDKERKFLKSMRRSSDKRKEYLYANRYYTNEKINVDLCYFENGEWLGVG